MSDKLEWLGRHLVLIRYTNIADAVANEHYKIPSELEELFSGNGGAEEMLVRLAKTENYKAACELLAYIAHRRAGVWWGYRCVLSLLEELKENPAQDRDISEIGADMEVKVPDWAKFEMPEIDTSNEAAIDASIAETRAKMKELEAKLDPEVHSFAKEVVEIAFQEFKRVHGIHPVDLLKKVGERIKEDPYPIDPNSPAFIEAAKLKAQVQAVRQETVDTIKSVLPPKLPAREKKLRDNALNAVCRWIAAPDAENSQKCLDIGNECPDTPAGLLSLTSFWSFGDLLPMGEQAVPTPPGLAANGLNQVFLMCALHKGGTRKVKERFKEYLRLGAEVLTGADNWEPYLAAGKAPHWEETSMNSPPNIDMPQKTPAENAGPVKPDTLGAGYHRWKPEEPKV